MLRSALLSASACGLAVLPLAAQRYWLGDDHARMVGVELASGILHQDPNVEPHVSQSSGVATLFVRVPISGRMLIAGELPVARTAESGFLASNGTAAGNPWIAVQGDVGHETEVEFGVRPRLHDVANYDAIAIASDDDFDHFEAWSTSATVFEGLVRIGAIPSHGGFTTGIVGATFGLLRGGYAGSSDPINANYGVRAGYRSSVAIWAVALTGKLAVDDCSGCDFDARIVNQVAGTAEFTHGTIHPQIGVRAFLDPSVRRTVRAVIMLGAVAAW